MLLALLPCGAITTFTFERDDPRGIALRLAGTGGHEVLRNLESPSGIWEFTIISLFAMVHPWLPETAIMSFSVGLENRDVPGGFANDPFDDFVSFSEPLVVREGFSFMIPDEFVPWTSDNFFAIDSRPEPLNRRPGAGARSSVSWLLSGCLTRDRRWGCWLLRWAGLDL